MSSLLQAISDRDVDALRRVLAQGVDVNQVRAEQDRTALHLACLHAGDSPQMSKVLLEHGADPNARDEAGDTPLHYSAQRDEPKLVELLLASNADVRLRNTTGATPLYLALKSRSPQCAQLLSRVDEAWSIEAAVVACDMPRVVKMLRESSNAIAESPLRDELLLDVIEDVATDAMEEAGFLEDDPDFAARTEAVVRRYEPLLRLILEQGGNPHWSRREGGWTPWHSAIQVGSPRLNGLLVAYGGDPDLSDSEAASSEFLREQLRRGYELAPTLRQ